MDFMRLAMRLAKKADPYPNPRVGAVLVKGGKAVGWGFHKAPGLPHAEIEAINDAKRRSFDPHAPKGATLYVTLEPCSHTAKRTPPCTDAIAREGIAKVVYAMRDPNPLVSGAKALMAAGIAVIGPTDRRAAERMNTRYMRNISEKPQVTIKMAMSADGKTATRTGDSRWISGTESRSLAHRMRAESDAIIVGAGTVKADNPELTSHGAGRNPYRVVVDGRLSIPMRSKILHNRDGRTIVATTSRAPRARMRALGRTDASVIVCGRDRVDLKVLFAGLSAMGMKRILIEGGNELNAEALESGVVGRLCIFIAPKIIGGKGALPVVGGRGISRMAQALRLQDMKIRRIGRDYLLEAKINAR
jgi:diaminohydroxyphosphoribosylaminopyrimidine deaminase / 5-amino-6-(5-phosphoribosylamino)uracil reductase